MKITEHDVRVDLLNTLLTTPHRQLERVHPVHADMVRRDPLFYARLAAWYHDRGEVRDHKEMFVVTLVTSDFEGHRDVGLALLRDLPPYQVARVVDFIHGTRRTRKAEGQEQPAVETVGLGRNAPRSLRTEVTRYLKEREADPDWFDSTVLTARKALKRLYALYHVAPGERAQRILFDDDPPADSRLHALKQLAAAAGPAEQARAIVEHRIPYRVAATVVSVGDPEVLKALVSVMTPQELINNLGALKKRGALEAPGVKELVEARLDEARKDKRVSAFKAQVAAEAAAVSGELGRKLDEVTAARARARGRIRRPTALLIDKSASMHEALEVGRQVGALVSAVCDSDLFAYTFDVQARPLTVSEPSLTGWEAALAGVYAGGATACGAGLDELRKAGRRVEQVILVTDGQENQAPRFADAYAAYCTALEARPDLILVKLGQPSDVLEKACKGLGLSPSVLPFKGDYYALANLVPLLAQPSMLDLVIEVMEHPLPHRRCA